MSINDFGRLLSSNAVGLPAEEINALVIRRGTPVLLKGKSVKAKYLEFQLVG